MTDDLLTAEQRNMVERLQVAVRKANAVGSNDVLIYLSGHDASVILDTFDQHFPKPEVIPPCVRCGSKCHINSDGNEYMCSSIHCGFSKTWFNRDQWFALAATAKAKDGAA